MSKLAQLKSALEEQFANQIIGVRHAYNELTVVLNADNWLAVAKALRDHDQFQFTQLMDVCGVDFLHYGRGEWETETSTATGFERGVRALEKPKVDKPRFAALYQLLSVQLNQRLRVRVYPLNNNMQVPSCVDIWSSANWYEREAFDLYGLLFNEHPDLRRILTDYGFIGHPFRKDFPLIGNVEMRYDAGTKRVVYEPVSIPNRTLVPKVIREDNRYLDPELEKEANG